MNSTRHMLSAQLTNNDEQEAGKADRVDLHFIYGETCRASQVHAGQSFAKRLTRLATPGGLQLLLTSCMGFFNYNYIFAGLMLRAQSQDVSLPSDAILTVYRVSTR
jgi:hypothetical protein